MSFAGLVDDLAAGRPVRRSRPGGRRTYAVIGERYYVDLSPRGLYAGVGAFRLRGEPLARLRDAGEDLDAALAEVAAAGLEPMRMRDTVLAGRAAPLAPDAPGARPHCEDTWAAARPLVEWMDACLGEHAAQRV